MPLYQIVLRRLLLLIPILWAVITVAFVLSRLAPGDPALALAGQHADEATLARTRHELGLDRPMIVQYGSYLWNVLRGDLGVSYASGQPVWQEIGQRLPATLLLTAGAMTMGITLGIGLGILSALAHRTWMDRLALIVALAGISTPVFWLGTMLILVCSVKLGWFPASGMGTPLLWFPALPAIALGTRSVALLARLTRTSLVETLHQDYLRTARAKGLSETTVITRHALRNALIPVITVIGLDTASYLSGAVLTEKVFAWPGVGRLIVDAIMKRDYAVMMGCVILLTIIFVVVNLTVDLLYTLVDPRVREV